MASAMTEAGERRATPRLHRLEDHGIVAARVRLGHEVSLIDVSAGGALIEGACRLLPGSTVDLQFETTERRAVVRGRVLRCAVARLQSSSVCYRGAVRFDGCFPWFLGDELCGYVLPTSECRSGRTRGVPTTHDAI
jgi:hypothetical protein